MKRLLVAILLLSLTGLSFAQPVVAVKQDGESLCATKHMDGGDSHNHRQGCLHTDHCAVADPWRLNHLPNLSFNITGRTFPSVPEDSDAVSIVLDLVDPPPRLA